jgi:hypothetical protein
MDGPFVNADSTSNTVIRFEQGYRLKSGRSTIWAFDQMERRELQCSPKPGGLDHGCKCRSARPDR